jgi:hypothetical protein
MVHVLVLVLVLVPAYGILVASAAKKITGTY